MAEGTNIIIIGVFLGFFSLVASMGAADLIAIEGLEDAQEVGLDKEEAFSVTEFSSKTDLKLVNVTDKFGDRYVALTPNETDSGSVTYDVSAVNEIGLVYLEKDASFFSNSLTVYDGSGNKLFDQDVSSDNVLTKTIGSKNIENTDLLEVQLNDGDVFFMGFIFPELDRNEGFVDRIFNFLDIFSLSSENPFVNYLIVTPLALYAVYFLIRNAGDYIPLT